MTRTASLSALLLLTSCAPQPFVGRVILEAESVEDMAKDIRCQSAWDVSPGHSAFACSWAFPDPRRNDGNAACHIVYEKSPRGVHAVGEEMYNCNTIDKQLIGYPLK